MTRAFSIVALIVGVAALYWPSTVALHGVWTDGEQRSFTHGYLLLAVSLWLVHRDRAALAAEPMCAVPLAWPVAVVASIAWLVFWRASIQDLHLLMLPAIAWLAVLGVFGWPTARRLALPLGVLYLAFPIWASLNGVLQQLTVQAVRGMVWLTGLPAYVEGNFVRVPAGMFEVEGGCSGLHFFVVGLALAVLYGEINRDPPRLRLRWIALLAGLSLLANWLRVFTIIVAGHLTDMQHYLVKVDHYRFGWVVFAVALIGFFWLASRTPASVGADGHGIARAGAARSPASFAPFPSWRIAVGCAAVAAGPALAAAGSLLSPDPIASGMPGRLLEWPTPGAEWVGPAEPAANDWQPRFQGATAAGLRRYTLAAAPPLDLFQAFYARQQQGAELVGEGSSLLGPDSGWQPRQQRKVALPSGDWRQMQVQTPAGADSLMLVRWTVDDRDFVTPVASQLWYGLASMWRPAPSSIIALRAPCVPDCAAAQQQLERFVAVVPLRTALTTTQASQTAGVLP